MGKQNISITTDAVVFLKAKNTTKVLLVQRKNKPFKDKWALPGGFLEENEPLENCAKRELREETGLKIGSLKQIKAFGTPGRDPRGRTISVAFYAEIPFEEKVKGADDAQDAKWFEITKLPELAFDHHEIVQTAIQMYLRKVTDQPA